MCGHAAALQLKAERAKIVKFLAGLNDSYGIIRRQIIMKKALPSLVEVYNILDQDDSQRGFSNIPQASDNSHLSSSPDSAVCYVQTGPNKGRPICNFCKRIGHIAERCYKKHGFPPGFVSKGKPNDKQQTPRPLAAQVSMSSSSAQHSSAPPDVKPNLNNLIGNLSKDQLQQFLALFSSQLQPQMSITENEASTSKS